MLIVTPNPAVDHTVRLERLRPGEVLRTGPGVSVAGGKGANVARAATCLGASPTVIGFVPSDGADLLHSLYAAEGFTLLPVPVSGRVRTCTAIIEVDGRVTLLNEPGATLPEGDWDRLMQALGDAQSASGNPICCSGSLPPGAPTDGYARIVRWGRAAGREVLVDASGEVLVEAIREGADLVCPNLSEAEAAILAVTSPGSAAPSPAAEPVDDDGEDVPLRAVTAAARLHEAGARWAVVTAGSAGAAVCGQGYAEWLAAPRVGVRNPIGAGDSFLAGVMTAREAGRPWPEAIRRGLATGSASVEQERAGVVDPARVDEFERWIAAR